MKKRPTKKPKKQRNEAYDVLATMSQAAAAEVAEDVAKLAARVADLEREMAAQLTIRDAVALALKADIEAQQAAVAAEQARARGRRVILDDYDRRHPLSGMGTWTHPSGDSITLTGNTGTR